MAKIRHINCPKCGGTLGTSEKDRVIKCNYCATWSLVDFPDFVPEYYVNPLVKEIEARRLIQSLLSDKGMPDDLLKQSRFHSARLCFIPYHELQARRLGTVQVTEFKEIRKPNYRSSLQRELCSAPGLGCLGEERLNTEKEKKIDTKVVLADITRLEPAINLPEWGLEESDINSIRGDISGVLQPMNRRKIQSQGRIFDATISTEQILTMLNARAGTAWFEDNTEVAEIRVKRIFYPVWRIRYRYQGRLYGVSVDGVTGSIMAARAPQHDRYRVLWLLGTSAVVSYIAGVLIRGIIEPAVMNPHKMSLISGIMAHGFHLIIPITIVGLAAAFFILAFGWQEFRYPGEIVRKGKTKHVEKIIPAEESFIDSLANMIRAVLGIAEQSPLKPDKDGKEA